MQNISVLFFVIFACLSACNKSETTTEVTDHFFLKNEGAVMPVFVNGNISSNIFVIYLHGGPGGTSLEAFQHQDNPFTKLQKDYAVVYWEQRCSGASQGECKNLTIEQYTEDLQKLLILLRHKYTDNISFFLVGHSWGGSLGINFLSKPGNQANVKGWIEVGGGHNVPRIVQLEKEMIETVGNRQILLGNNIAEWQNRIENANKLNLGNLDDVYAMNSLASEAESSMRISDSVYAKISNTWVNEYFFGSTEWARASKNAEFSFEGMKNELSVLNLTDKLQEITVPTLLLWGKYDFRVPSSFAREEFVKYGSISKELVIFEKSAHFVQWNEPNAFFEKVKEFIELHR